jgi:hypothetical protein
MLGIFSKSKTISTRLGRFEQEQFLAFVKEQNKSVADVLRDAVIFYLDNQDKSGPAQKQTTVPGPEEKKLLPLDYDDLSSEPRLNRFLWGG